MAGFANSVSIEKLRREMYQNPEEELVSLLETSQNEKTAPVEHRGGPAVALNQTDIQELPRRAR